jgi:hypothetical protein
MSNPTSPASPRPAQNTAPPQPPPRTASTDAEVSARSTKHAAWVAAGSAIIAAIVAVGGTVWSGRESVEASDRAAQTAADTAVKAVSIQLSGETEKSRAEFLPEQRRVLYITIIAHEVEIHESEQKIIDDIAVAGKGKTIRATADKLATRYEKLEKDRPPAEIIASPPVRERLAALSKTHRDVRQKIFVLAFRDETHGIDGLDGDDLVWINRYEKERKNAFDAFCQAARKDMGSE